MRLPGSAINFPRLGNSVIAFRVISRPECHRPESYLGDLLRSGSILSIDPNQAVLITLVTINSLYSWLINLLDQGFDLLCDVLSRIIHHGHACQRLRVHSDSPELSRGVIFRCFLRSHHCSANVSVSACNRFALHNYRQIVPLQ